MKRSKRGPATLILISLCALFTSCGLNDEDRKRIADLEQSVADEIRLLREEVARAKLAPDDKVDIELQGVGLNTKIAIVHPPKKSSCKDSQSNCGREVRWTLRGAIPDGWYVQIEEKASSHDKDCFAEPRFTKSERVKMSGEPAESCRGAGAQWEYSVTLYDQNGVAKSMVDPLIVMNWSA